MDENDYDIDELINDELETDLLEATTIIQETLTTIDNNLSTCVNLLLFADILIALTIGCICASILSRFLEVRR